MGRGRRRGVGRALVDALSEATRAYALPGFMVNAPDHDEESLAVAGRWGFDIVGRHRESVLELATLDAGLASAATGRAAAQGFRLVPMSDDAGEAEWRRVYELVMTLWKDAPDGEGSTDDMPYPVFRGFFPDPSYVLLAWRGAEPVGITSVIDREKDTALNTWFTGVTRAARGRGLATALKAEHALRMRERGHRRLFTQNMEGNEGILAANERLGFRVDSGYVDLALAVPHR